MKSNPIFILALLVLLAFAAPVSASDNIDISLSAGALFARDSNFRTVYVKTVFSPVLEVGYKISPAWHLFAGFDYFSKSGLTIDYREPVRGRQFILAAGAGYQRRLSARLTALVRLGAVCYLYREELLGEKVSGTAAGIRAEAGIDYDLKGKFFFPLRLSWSAASATPETQLVRFGGFSLRAGIGIRL